VVVGRDQGGTCRARPGHPGPCAAIGSVYGAAAQKQFLKLWRAHIGFFVNYTLGVATHNSKMVATAQHDLNGYISQFSAFHRRRHQASGLGRRGGPEGARLDPGDRDQRDRGPPASEWASSQPPPGFRRA
jgi:hypothetical protein